MKQIMWMTLAASLAASFNLLATEEQRPSQNKEVSELRRYLEQRHELHQRMMDKLFRGFGDDSDIFKEFEQMFDQSLSDRLGASPRTLGFQGPANFGMDWMESAKGRTLVITPTSKGQALDINVDGRAVTVKGKSEAKSEFGSSVSSFSNSFPVPEDCDASKVKIEQDKEKILVFFPFSGKAPGTERSPLPSTGNDVRI